MATVSATISAYYTSVASAIGNPTGFGTIHVSDVLNINATVAISTSQTSAPSLTNSNSGYSNFSLSSDEFNNPLATWTTSGGTNVQELYANPTNLQDRTHNTFRAILTFNTENGARYAAVQGTVTDIEPTGTAANVTIPAGDLAWDQTTFNLGTATIANEAWGLYYDNNPGNPPNPTHPTTAPLSTSNTITGPTAYGGTRKYYVYNARAAAAGGAGDNGTSDGRDWFPVVSFSKTRGTPDTTPSFDGDWIDTTGQPLNTVVKSPQILIVSGLDIAVSASISGASGQYRIDTYANGSWTPWSSSNSAAIIINGSRLEIRATSGSSFSQTTTTTLTVGGDYGSSAVDYSITTLAQDVTPTQFNIGANVSGAPLSTNYDSSFVIGGINDTVTVTGSSGALVSTTNGSGYTTSISRVNGQTVYVRITSSSSFSTAVNGIVTIGTVSDTRTITTLAQDVTPTQFNIGADVTGAALNTPYLSSFTVTGINTTVTVTGSGAATVSASSSGPWSSSINRTNNQTVHVRIISSSSANATVTGTVSIETVSDTRSITTGTGDTAPNAFELGGPVTNVSTSGQASSNTVTVLGVSAGANVPISISKISSESPTGVVEYSVNQGTPTSSSGTVQLNDEVAVIITCSSANSATTTAELNIGGTIDTFSATTEAATSGSVEGPAASSDYGLRVFSSSSSVLLDVTDRVATVAGVITGSFTAAQTTKTHTLTRNGTMAIRLDPDYTVTTTKTELITATVSGTTLTVSRSEAGTAKNYTFLVIFE